MQSWNCLERFLSRKPRSSRGILHGSVQLSLARSVAQRFFGSLLHCLRVIICHSFLMAMFVVRMTLNMIVMIIICVKLGFYKCLNSVMVFIC